jgi:hypothetical protein
MKTLHFLTPVVILAALVLSTCEPIEKVSNVPEIHFKSFALYNKDTLDDFNINVGVLIFSFIDGNADIGVMPNATDTLNVFLEPFQKVHGIYEPLNVDTFGQKFSLKNDPSLVRIGQNKTIKGEIKVEIIYPYVPSFDTMRYEFYILDRAGNKSNVDSTSDITFPNNLTVAP